MSALVGIDIRNQHVRAVLLRTSYRRVALEAVREIERSETDTLHQAIQACVLPLTQHADAIAVAVEGEACFVHRLAIPATAAKQIEQVLPFELEAQVPVDLDELVYDHVASPRFSTTEALEVLAVAARKTSVRDRVDLVRESTGHEPARVSAGALPLSNLAAIAPELLAADPVAVVDLGDSRTEIVVMNNGGHPVAARTLSVGTAGLPASASRLAAGLRQTFVAAGLTAGNSIRTMYLVGGGAGAPGAEEYLSSELGVSVSRLTLTDLDGVTPEQADVLPRYAKALALALSLRGRGRDPNLRQGELSYERGFAFLKNKAPLLAGLAASVFVSFAFSAWAEMRSLSAESETLTAALGTLSKRALGEETEDPERASELLSQVTNPLERDPMPELDAFDVMIELSKVVPSTIVHDVEELDMQREHVKIRGIVGATSEAQQIADAMKQNRCFQDVKITKVTQVVNGTRQKYVMEFDVKCPEEASKKKGKGSEKAESE